MFKLLKRARQLHVGLPPLTQTRYINTISPEQEPFFPGDEELERRIRRLVRWNAVAMVLRANSRYPGIGGHLATYASAAIALRGRLQPLLPGQGRGGRGPGLLPGPRGAGDLRPRVPRGSPDRGPARPLPARGRAGPGAELLPASAPDARLLGVPDRLDGDRPDQRHLPGPVQPLPPEPRPEGHLGVAGLGVPRRRRDGRARVDRRAVARGPRGARQPDLRRQLQPAAPGRPGPRQRQDHPGARGPVPRRRLERDQGDLGPRVGRPPRPRRRRCPRRADERDPRRRVPEVLGRRRGLHPRALLRARPATPPARGAPHRRRPGQAPPGRPRLPQGVRRVQGGDRVRRGADGDPGPHDQGLDARTGGRGAQHHPPGQEAVRGRAHDLPRPAGAADPRLGPQGRAVLPPRARTPRRSSYLRERRAALGGFAPEAGRPGQAVPVRRTRVRRRVRGRQPHAGVDDDGVRPDPAQPDPRQGARAADRPDHAR